jgi:hypothetical protein
MEPVDVEVPEHDGPISKPVLNDIDTKESGKRAAHDDSGDEKKPAVSLQLLERWLTGAARRCGFA